MTTLSQAISGVATDDAGRFQTSRVVTVAGGHAVHDTFTAFLPPLLPALIDEFSLSTTQAGLLNVFLQWPSLLQPFIGYLADHINLRYLFILAPAVTAAAMSLLGIAPSYAVLAMLLIAAGLSSAGLHTVGSVIAGNLSGRKFGRAMGLWMVGGGLGYTIGPLILVAALQFLRLDGIPWLMAGGLLASAALYARLHNVSSSSCSASYVAARPWRQALRAMQPLMGPVIILTVARSFVAGAMNTYLPIFLSREGSTLWFAGMALSVYEAAGMAGSLTAGSLSDRLGRRQVLGLATVAASLLTGIFLVVHGPAQLVILLGVGFSTLAIMPVIMALMQETFPENRALANGIYLGLNFAIQAGATVVLGVLGDRFGLRQAFIFSAAIQLVGLPSVLLLPKENR